MMLRISNLQIDAVRQSPILSPHVLDRLDDPTIVEQPIGDLSKEALESLRDAVLEALVNEAPEVESFNAEQDKGAYSVTTLGVPGAYFVFAIEFDRAGVFSTLDEARDYAEDIHGEFRVTEREKNTGEADEEERNVTSASTDDRLAEAQRRMPLELTTELRTLIRDHVNSFEKTLPKPQGAIAGMARIYKKLPKLEQKVAWFFADNKRLPDHDEILRIFNEI